MKHGLKVIKGSNWSLVRNEGFPTAKRGELPRLPWRDRVKPSSGRAKSKLIGHSLWLLWLLWGQRVPVNKQKESAQEWTQAWPDEVTSPWTLGFHMRDTETSEERTAGR